MTADPRHFLASGLRDNRGRGTVADFLQEKIQPGAALSVVSAYFTIYAFDHLSASLSGIEGLRFLFGEPSFLKIDPERTDRKAFQIEDEGLQLQNRLEQKRVARDCASWIRAKVAIRSVRQRNLLHGKMYHIAHGGLEEAILGSSNFTVRGLGLAGAGNNIELNLEVNDRRDRQDLKAWFDAIWQDEQLTEDVTEEVLAYLEQLYADCAPEFIYYKTLFHLFEELLAEQARGGLLDERVRLVDSQIWSWLFEFQRDGVRGAINKILKHGGCIIADSVGLGKTFEALAIIRYFELLNQRVLVLCPKKLRENWTVYLASNNSALNPFLADRFNYTVLSHTDLSRDGGRTGDVDLATLNWGNYDLVVIDESHNFRNNAPGSRDETGQIVRRSRYQRLMEEIIQAGVKTKVLLLSATPVNNDLRDLRNQLYFITEGRDDHFRETMGIYSLRDTLGAAQRTFNEWARGGQGERQSHELLERLGSPFFKLLDELTIARSRRHIERYYGDTIAQLGGFPERLPPLALFPDIDQANRIWSYEKLNDEISQYRLALFNPSRYVKLEYATLYQREVVQNFSQGDRERYLIGMMKVNFLKRLESSVASFTLTMERTIAKLDDLLARIERFEQFQQENALVEVETLAVETDDEELQAALQVGKSLKYQMAHLDLAAWKRDLRKDREQLEGPCWSAKQVTAERDAKLAELRGIIAAKVTKPPTDKQGRPNRKVLLFTAFADTALYLYTALLPWATEELGIHVAMVTGGTAENRTTLGRNDFNEILTHFSPLSKRRALIPHLNQEAEIDLLIATDCISEGQNLQDCDMVINYDIHWNPVRIIQRFGRVDRIGSRAHAVQLVNFWPTPNLDHYIGLRNRVEARMALIDVTATGEDNLLRADIEEMVQTDLRYRDRQLLRLRDEVLDIEELTEETVALSEFTLDDFRVDLTRYLESNRRLLAEAPLGLYAVVPHDPAYATLRPGLIFCLRQRGAARANETINPLQPYYLAYVWQDGTVRYGFAQPKQILDILRHLCVGQGVHQELCDLFDKETQHGQQMAPLTALLERAVESITQSYQRRALGSLLSGRHATLPPEAQQLRDMSDFDLITWLVVR